MKYQLPDGNVILADQKFIDAKYPGAVLIAEPVVADEEKEKEDDAEILKMIADVEAGQARGIREFLLTGDKTGLQWIEDQIVALRGNMKKAK